MTRLFIKTVKTLIINTSKSNNSVRQYSTPQECFQSNSLISEEDNLSQKLLKVAVIGMPNAGKSTFINQLMDRKVCPTSAKVHTTRKKTQAIFTEGDSQIIFLDTPGLVTNKIQKRHHLEKSFISDSATCLQQADTIGVIHDVGNAYTREVLDIKIIKLLEKHHKKPSFLVFNKVDVLKSKRKLLELTRLITMNCLDGKPLLHKKSGQTDDDIKSWPNFKEVFMVSALTGNGLLEVKDYLISCAQPGKWPFPADVWSDQTPEKIIVDTVKATLLDFLPQEIPYQMEPILELYEVNDDEKINIVVLVKCVSERVARLAAGASSGRLRQITEKTQKDLQDVFHQFVKIRIILQPPKDDKQMHKDFV